MPRRGWSAIPTPSGWYEVIHRPRPPSVQPHVSKGKGKGKGKKPSPVVSALQKSQGQSKVARFEAALQVFGARAVNCENSVGGGPQGGEGRSREANAPTTANCRSVRTSRQTRSCSTIVGRDDNDAEPLKVALKKARVQAQVFLMGERLDLCLQYIAQVKKQVAGAEDHVRAAREVHSQMEKKLANGLRDLEVLRAEASEQPRQCFGSELETNEDLQIESSKWRSSRWNANQFRRPSPVARKRPGHWAGFPQICRH